MMSLHTHKSISIEQLLENGAVIKHAEGCEHTVMRVTFPARNGVGEISGLWVLEAGEKLPAP